MTFDEYLKKTSLLVAKAPDFTDKVIKPYRAEEFNSACMLQDKKPSGFLGWYMTVLSYELFANQKKQNVAWAKSLEKTLNAAGVMVTKEGLEVAGVRHWAASTSRGAGKPNAITSVFDDDLSYALALSGVLSEQGPKLPSYESLKQDYFKSFKAINWYQASSLLFTSASKGEEDVGFARQFGPLCAAYARKSEDSSGGTKFFNEGPANVNLYSTAFGKIFFSRLVIAMCYAYVFEVAGGYVFSPKLRKLLDSTGALDNKPIAAYNDYTGFNGVAMFRNYYGTREEAVIIATLESMGVRCYFKDSLAAKSCIENSVYPIVFVDDDGKQSAIFGFNRVLSTTLCYALRYFYNDGELSPDHIGELDTKVNGALVLTSGTQIHDSATCLLSILTSFGLLFTVSRSNILNNSGLFSSVGSNLKESMWRANDTIGRDILDLMESYNIKMEVA